MTDIIISFQVIMNAQSKGAAFKTSVIVQEQYDGVQMKQQT